MNNPVKITLGFAVLSVLSFSPHTATAQDRSDKPVPPFVAAIPDFFQWTISIEDKPDSLTSSASSSTAPAREGKPLDGKQPTVPTVQKVVFVKTKGTCVNTVFYNDGKSFEAWYYDKKLIVKSPGGAVLVYSAGTPAAFRLVPDVSSDGFVGVDWIKATNFQTKTQLSGGREVFVYRGNAGLRSASDTAQKEVTGPIEASIDAQTGFPLMVKEGTRVLVYSYQAPPVQMLTLPAEAQKDLASLQEKQNMVEKLRALSRHPPPPSE